jgi:Subtilase family
VPGRGRRSRRRGRPGRAFPARAARPAARRPRRAAQLVKDTAGAWEITRGSGVTVAVLGSGVDPHAVGLAGKVVIGHDYVRLPYPPPVSGTVIASAIAGSGPTGTSPVGPIGRAPQARILSIRIYPEPTIPGAIAWDNSADWDTIIAHAIREAVNRGAQVIYDTVYDATDSLLLEQAVQYAVSRNVVVISDGGGSRSNRNQPSYPVSLPGVLGVANADLPGLVPPSPRVPSPRNESILVSAPGNQLLASGPAGPNYSVQNDWAAGAWVVGTAALIKSVYPSLSPALVARAIALSARDHPPGGYNTAVGFGMINPAGALHEASALVTLRATAAPGAGVASPPALFGPGPAPGVIDAAHPSAARLAGLGGAVALGIACLVLAAALARRWRRRRPAPGRPAGAAHAPRP